MKGSSFTAVEDAIVIKHCINCDMSGTHKSRIIKAMSEILLATNKDRPYASVSARISILKRRLKKDLPEEENSPKQPEDNSEIELMGKLKKLSNRQLKLMRAYIDYIINED